MEEKCKDYGRITHFKIAIGKEWPKAGSQLQLHEWHALHKCKVHKATTRSTKATTSGIYVALSIALSHYRHP